MTEATIRAGEPLLVAEDLRIDVDGIPTCDGLTARSSGDRVLVLGGPRALFEAICGLRPVVRGALRLCGVAAATAARQALVAGAPLDPPLPPKWTVFDYITWSSRLAGNTAGDARRLTHEAIDLLQLEPFASGPIARLVAPAKRGVVVAAAVATGANVIALEDPLAMLQEDEAHAWAKILVQALSARSWIVVAGRIPLTSPLATHADDALVVSDSRVDAQGAPADIARARRRFVARIHGSLDALGTKLAEQGAHMAVQGAHVELDLGERVTTAELLRLATETDATIVELVPVASALA